MKTFRKYGHPYALIVLACMTLCAKAPAHEDKSREVAPTPRVDYPLPEPNDALKAYWGQVPSIPVYSRAYLYVDKMLETGDPFLIALSSAKNISPGMVWMIKATVSGANKCHYCLSQAVIMAQACGYSEDAVYMTQFDPGAAPVSDKDKALLLLARKMTLSPWAVQPAVEAAREAGWTNGEIAQAIFIAAAWNYTNRFANAFGLEPDWLHPYDEGSEIPFRQCATEAERQFVREYLGVKTISAPR